jgi:putative two-component system response regulator
VENPIRVLIAEDSDINITILRSVFAVNTDYELLIAHDGVEALDLALSGQPDVILLDIMMPRMDGFEVARRLKQEEKMNDVPIIFLTALDDDEFKMRAFEMGGIDYVTKPVNKNVLLARVSAMIRLKRSQDELRIKNLMLQDSEFHLSRLVDQKTREIEQITVAMISALENANHFNDPDTGSHIRRVAEYSGLLAEKYGCDPQFVRRVKIYTPLHDVGKVGIPDSILKKPGKLSGDEFQQMKHHVVIGFQMLNAPGIDNMAANIALYHHEKWDGAGYINGKRGYDIPLEARIVTLADVYDALSFSRAYKDAFTEERTEELIMEGKGVHFEPRLVDILYQNLDRFIDIKQRMK